MSFVVPAVTGYSSFYGEGINDYQPLYARSTGERAIGVVLARQSNRAMRASIRALTGVAPGSSEATSYARISAPAGLTDAQGLGGLRTIETFVVQTGNTAASDVTYINAQINDAVFNQAPASYPVDAAGVGGGGKAGI
ncbi:hypothetical protein UFOVP810_34 [uncultured Caudovirales phage]|uniref:Uncharacterized protein n=1 Tax=uncultured Caudovirales phage TaxID=2100421 RepID=A0A6J5P2K9_9CAUD|nr:hypothetical protein UFOVP810_34 [uncultured Caudovirales phage]